jgi:hypothetical protein
MHGESTKGLADEDLRSTSSGTRGEILDKALEVSIVGSHCVVCVGRMRVERCGFDYQASGVESEE